MKPTIYRFHDFLSEKTKNFPQPMSTMLVEQFGPQPFIILIACLLSLRARDTATYPVVLELFKRYTNPEDFVAADVQDLEFIIHSVGFYKRKARILQQVCQYLIDHHNGQVPNTYEALIAIPHVGPKTANLVLAEAFNVPAICVDTHVHRLAQHMGLVNGAKTPEQTEAALKKIIPQELWSDINRLLVVWGQNICTPWKRTCTCPHISDFK